MVGPHDPWTLAEVDRATLRKASAPGHDGGEARVIGATADTTNEYFHQVFTNCLRVGYFPTAICAFLKSGHPPELPSSYRLISLLPEIGKVLGTLILNCVRSTESGGLHPNQYSGVPEVNQRHHAICQLQNIISISNEKYAVGILFDICKAFDRMWWPAVFNSLRQRLFPAERLQLVKSYLNQRKAYLECGEVTCSQNISMGVPQGSVLGPYLWSVLFD